MEDGWISSIAYAQNETFEPLQPSVAGKTVLAELENGLAGECFRIVLGERYGSKAVTYGNTVMQIRDTVLPLSFQGKQSVIVTPGCQACSDAVQFPIQPGERCRLWLYVEGEVASCSATLQAAVHSKKGNYAGKLFAAQTQAPVVPGLEVEERLCGVSALQVHTSRGAGGHSIVAFGDSITQMGYWTNPLRRRIQGANKNATLLNMGIGGNKLLRDTHIPQIKGIQMFGEAGLKRFAWDVAQQPGVKAVVLALGINDITLPGGMPARGTVQLGRAVRWIPAVDCPGTCRRAECGRMYDYPLWRVHRLYGKNC